jgi:hypothetical protein
MSVREYVMTRRDPVTWFHLARCDPVKFVEDMRRTLYETRNTPSFESMLRSARRALALSPGNTEMETMLIELEKIRTRTLRWTM